MASKSGKVSSRKGRPNYAREFKRQLAVAACSPDVSVAKLALAHGINANMIFKWRRHYRAGQLGGASPEHPVLLPVTIGAADESRPRRIAQTNKHAVVVATSATRAAVAATACIEIEIASATIRLRGAVDVVQLRLVLDCLGRVR